MTHRNDRYAASYYSYLWCKGLAALIWTTSFVDDPLSRTAGDRYRKSVLAYGSARDPWLMVEEVQLHVFSFLAPFLLLFFRPFFCGNSRMLFEASAGGLMKMFEGFTRRTHAAKHHRRWCAVLSGVCERCL